MSFFALDQYSGNGSNDTFAISFPRLLDTHVTVWIDESLQTETTHYTIVGDEVVFVSAPSDGAKVELIRNSSQGARLVDYMNGAGFQEATLDQDSIQGFYMAQEAIDRVTLGIEQALAAVSGSGEVPGAANPGDNGKVLTAGSGAYSWEYISTSSLAISTDVKALADAANLAAVITLLGLGSVYPYDVGTSANNIVQLDGSARLPAVDASQLTNVPGAPARSDSPGDVTHGTDADHDLDFPAMTLVLDGGAVVTFPALTKQVDASWASGDNAGGLDTGTVQADTWYSLWAIYKSSDGSKDYMISTDVSTPSNLPTGYDDYRRIGWRLTDGSANFVPSSQDGDKLYLSVPVNDSNLTAFGATTAITPTLTVAPLTTAMCTMFLYHASTSTRMLVTSLDHQADTAPSSTLLTAQQTPGQAEYVDVEVKVNSSSQIRMRCDNAATVYSIVTRGHIDRRGRDG